MKQYRITRKAGDAFYTIQRKVWWGWKYDSYAVHIKSEAKGGTEMKLTELADKLKECDFDDKSQEVL